MVGKHYPDMTGYVRQHASNIGKVVAHIPCKLNLVLCALPSMSRYQQRTDIGTLQRTSVPSLSIDLCPFESLVNFMSVPPPSFILLNIDIQVVQLVIS